MICTPLGAITTRTRPLGEVGAGAVEWTGERLQALINDFNVMGNRLITLQRAFQERYEVFSAMGDAPVAAIWAVHARDTWAMWDACRRRKDWIYTLAYYTATDRWEPQGQVIQEMINNAYRAGFIAPQGLGVLPLAAGLVAVLAGLVAWLAWLGDRADERQQVADADKLRSGEKTKLREMAENPRLPAQLRNRAMDILGEYTEALATQTPDLGTQRSSGSDYVLPLALLALVVMGGKKLMGAS